MGTKVVPKLSVVLDPEGHKCEVCDFWGLDHPADRAIVFRIPQEQKINGGGVGTVALEDIPHLWVCGNCNKSTPTSLVIMIMRRLGRPLPASSNKRKVNDACPDS